MSKLPAFQFYPADWRKDPGVQSLSFHDRGVWFEILCLMHESEQRGKLLLGGQPMPDAALARLLGLDKQNLTNTISTLISYGVASRCPDTGALISRRMVRDEELRKVRQNAGKLGGNPNLVKQNTTKSLSTLPSKLDKQNQTPSSSSSITNDLYVRAREITLKFFGVNEIKNFKAFKEISNALELIDQHGKIDYYIQQIEAYNRFKNLTGQQKCNYNTWFFGEKIEEHHIDNGHWCRIDYNNQLKDLENNGKTRKSNALDGTKAATAAIESGKVKDFGSIKL